MRENTARLRNEYSSGLELRRALQEADIAARWQHIENNKPSLVSCNGYLAGYQEVAQNPFDTSNTSGSPMRRQTLQ